MTSLGSKPIRSPLQVALAVCKSLEGSTPDRILAPQRGTPRTVYMRDLCMMLWAEQHEELPSYTAIGAAFGRNRRSASRSLVRLLHTGLPSRLVLKNINDRLA